MFDQEIRDTLSRWIEAAQLSLNDFRNEGKRDEEWLEALMQSCENTLEILGWAFEDDEHIVVSAFVAGIAYGEHLNLKPDAVLYTDLLLAIVRHQERRS